MRFPPINWISLALLAGCATQADRTAQVEREVDEMIATYGPACEKLGYQSASDPWSVFAEPGIVAPDVHVGEVVGEEEPRLQHERGAQHGRIDIRVAVAIAADPAPHREEGR